MLKSIQQRDIDRNRWIKITMTVLLVLISLSMLTYLIPGLTNTSATSNPDAVASVGGTSISILEVQRQLSQLTHGQNIPPMLKGMYTKQVLDQMVFQHSLELEAQRLGGAGHLGRIGAALIGCDQQSYFHKQTVVFIGKPLFS